MTSRYVVHDVAPDGSCFYRSIFQVLKYHGYLYTLCMHMFNTYISNEDEFVVATRRYLSNMVTKHKDSGHIHNMYVKLRDDDDMTYSIIIEGMPSWFVRKFPKRPSNEEVFRKEIATAIAKKSSWASEVDIPIFTAVFGKCFKNNLKLVVMNEHHTQNGLPKGFKMEKGKVYILNLNETHYNYVVDTRIKVCIETQVRNPQSLRCVKKDGRVGRNMLKRSVQRYS